ncbi:MAG: PRC-barrel domain-containing protein [Sphingomonadaceae bacterium]
MVQDDLATNETSSLISSDKVNGTAVYSRDGERLGSIANFMVDKRSGRVEYAVLSFGGFLGIGSDHYPLPWDILEYDTRQGGYVVDLAKDVLEKAPRYSRDREPEFDRAYGEEIYGYYNVPYLL